MWFYNNHLSAPQFIFVRCAEKCPDVDLLQAFGLSTYRRAKWLWGLERYVVLADDGQWTMVADDWFYTLWHMSSTRPAIEKLGRNYEVFACSINDWDYSFEFVYYSDGRLVRRYVVKDLGFRRGQVVENFGEPLPGESVAFREADELDIVLKVAASLGIRVDYTKRDIRVYKPC
jgi:hypothetical protein